MYILKNSVVSIFRNKGRNILIGIIILVIAASSTVTLAIRNTSNRLVKNYEESHDIIASISFDRRGMMENFKGGEGGLITINDGDIYIKASGDGIDSNKNLIMSGGNVYTIGSSVGGDAGIDTDEGFEINGGTVIALGSDMLEKPENSSKQKSVCFTLNSKISKRTEISLRNETGEEIISFEAKEDFKTLIISNSKLTNGTYYLYENGEKTEYTAKT